MNYSTKKAWRQYEAGKEYKRRIGLYETVKRNESFYRGDQWQSTESAELPHPVFNIIRRVMDYLISSVTAAELNISFSDEKMPFLASERDKEVMQSSLDALTSHAAYRWEKCNMSSKALQAVRDAAITGDGVFYCYWNPDIRGVQLFDGDIVTEVIDNTNLFVSDVNNPDIQSQEYIILAGRASVASLRSEASDFGISDEDILKISGDGDTAFQSGEMAKYELDDPESEKATYIIKFYRENGRVVFEKSTRECLIRRGKTDCRLYPVAYFNWTPTKNSFHGTSPVTYLIPNQKFINRAYALAMKHMTDTAFSKVVYDKSKIPEWSNEVGQAIAAMGGGSVADSVSVVGVGEMQSGYTELIDSAVTLTKEFMGATESALGNLEASNTSAILALQETSRIPLEQIRSAYYRCIEELANIWADMMCAYYPDERLLQCGRGCGDILSAEFSLLKRGLLCARVDVTESTRYSAASLQNLLDKLLDGGYITPSEYVSRLPSGVISSREALIERLKESEERKKENTL